jgi:hypothetical protein
VLEEEKAARPAGYTEFSREDEAKKYRLKKSEFEQAMRDSSRPTRSASRSTAAHPARIRSLSPNEWHEPKAYPSTGE